MQEELDLKAYLAERRELVNRALAACLPVVRGPAFRVVQAMHYSLFAGGKRLRPILCLAAAEAVGGGQDEVLPLACALEMIHTYSLIHDDLPAMDDDDLRRGQPPATSSLTKLPPFWRGTVCSPRPSIPWLVRRRALRGGRRRCLRSKRC